MSSIWFTSDHHFGQTSFLAYRDNSGQLIRPFSSLEEMDEHMISQWNAFVRPGDKVYHLGDFTTVSDVKLYTSRLHGKKRLILGNHDDLGRQNLCDNFQKVQMWRIFKEEGFVCTHVPIMRENFDRLKLNVHGHIHQNEASDEFHMNVCVDKTSFRPIHMDEIKQTIIDRCL